MNDSLRKEIATPQPKNPRHKDQGLSTEVMKFWPSLKIEKMDDLIRWATYINGKILTNGERADLQDIYARSDVQTLKGLIRNCDQMPLVACSVHNVMGWDAVAGIIKTLAGKKAQEIIDKEIEAVVKREIEVVKRENVLSDSKKYIYKRLARKDWEIDDLKDEVSRLKTRNEDILNRSNENYRDAMNNEIKAKKWDQLQALINS